MSYCTFENLDKPIVLNFWLITFIHICDIVEHFPSILFKNTLLRCAKIESNAFSESMKAQHNFIFCNLKSCIREYNEKL